MSDLDELDRLAAAATPGPWAYEYDGAGTWTIQAPPTPDVSDGCVAVVAGEPNGADDPDGPYIVALVNAAPSLIARLRAAESIVSTVYGGLDEHSDDAGKLRSIATWLDRIDNATDAMFESRGQEHRVGRQVQAELRRIAETVR